MISLFETIKNTMYYKVLSEEFAIIEGNEVMQLNESFQSELLRNLASQIKKAEAKNNANIKRKNEEDKARGYSYVRPYTSFASIFGPLTIPQRFGDEKKGIQGLLWSDIKDEDFKLIKAGDEKSLKKELKEIFVNKGNGDAICCIPGTKDPVMFIKGYGKKDEEKRVFYFNMDQSKWDAGVKEKTVKKYSYQTRPLRLNELLPLLSDVDVYILTITNDMINNYEYLRSLKTDAQAGVVNTDEQSLKALLKKQQARYAALVKKIKAEKLQSDPNVLFDEINKTQQEVVDLMKQIMSNPEYMDKRYDIGNLLNYMSYAYESFYNSSSDKRSSQRRKEAAKERAKNAGKEFDDETYDQYDFDKLHSDEYIRDAKNYIQKVKKAIEEIKNDMK